MASFIWNRDPQEAYLNPYEYEAQGQFAREAAAVLEWLDAKINPPVRRFDVEDKSLAKALWMLRTDILDNLHEALLLINERRHRPAARLFRDVFESADFARTLALDPVFAHIWLPKWYLNETPNHRVLRMWIQRKQGELVARERQRFYRELSKFAHRSYRALLKSYSVGGENKLVHDRWASSGILVLPQTISAYYAILADLILLVIDQFVESGAIAIFEMIELWETCLEDVCVPRRWVQNPFSLQMF